MLMEDQKAGMNRRFEQLDESMRGLEEAMDEAQSFTEELD